VFDQSRGLQASPRFFVDLAMRGLDLRLAPHAKVIAAGAAVRLELSAIPPHNGVASLSNFIKYNNDIGKKRAWDIF